MICAIVLAAGRSVRMGTQKLLLPLGGIPVIARIVDELLPSPVQQAFVVIGRDGKQIREALGSRTVSFVENPDPEGDMLSSVRCGIGALPASCEAALIVLGDQPGVTRQLIAQLTGAHVQKETAIVVPEFNGKRGHPLLLGARFFTELLQRYDGVGLQGLLNSHPEAVHRIPVGTSQVLDDMDTPEDYQRHIGLSARPK